MALELPKEFTNIPLAHLWEMLKVAKELKGLAKTADEEAYWVGWNDTLATLLGDLTGLRTFKEQEALAAKFEDFRMEDKLLDLEEREM